MAGKDSTLLDIDQDPTDQLEFQDIPHIHGSEKGPRDEDGQTHTFTTFPAAADDSEDEVEGKPQLLTDKKQPSFWTFEYYQTLFDVDTIQVVIRILNSVVPRPKSNYLQSYIRPNPDLYGPFWICATLIFTTAITGNLANYFHTEGRDYEWTYDFHKVTFSATAIFSYWLLVPLALWGFLWWRRSSAGYSFLEILCVYGYSLAIYVPVSILWVINISWLQYLLVILSMVLSGTVLVIVFWPAVKEDDKKVALGTLLVIFLLHGLLAVGFMLYFFRFSSESGSSSNVTTPAAVTSMVNLQANLEAQTKVTQVLTTSAKQIVNSSKT